MNLFYSYHEKVLRGGQETVLPISVKGCSHSIKHLPKKQPNSPDKFWIEPLDKNTQGHSISLAKAREIYPDKYLELIKILTGKNFQNPVGAPGDSNPPPGITSKVRLSFPQGDLPYCLGHSLASALHYCGFQQASLFFFCNAALLSNLPVDRAMFLVRHFMECFAPSISNPTLFNIRQSGCKK